MWMIVRLLIAAVLCILVLPLSAAYATRLDLRQLNLRLADLPPGYEVIADDIVDNAAAAKDDKLAVAQEVQSGRLSGSRVQFMSSGGGSKSGPFAVTGSVDAYDTPAHTRAAYLRTARQIDQSTSPQSLRVWGNTLVAHGRVRDPAFMHVGVQRVAWVVGLKIPLRRGFLIENTYTCLFYRGQYIIQITTFNAPTDDVSQLATLALTVDGRIKHVVS